MAQLTTGNGLPDVVVTGVAMTTSLATDAETTWKALQDGQSGIRTLDDPFVEQYDLPVRIGGHLLEDFDGELTRVELRRLSYLQKMSTVVGRRAWQNAGSPEVDTKRLMVSIGTGMGAAEELVFAYDGMRARGLRAVSPLVVQMYMPNGAAAAVGLDRKAKAGVSTPISACASGSEAIAAPGATSCSARRTSRSAAAWRPRSKRCRLPGSPRCGSSCRPPTTTRPAPADRSTGIVMVSSSARAARCSSSRPRIMQSRGVPTFRPHHGREHDLGRLPHRGARPQR